MVLALSSALGAQVAPPPPSFVPALTVGYAYRDYGVYIKSALSQGGYAGGSGFNAELTWPVTSRGALLLSAMATPGVATQEQYLSSFSVSANKSMSTAFAAHYAFKLKPDVPAFFVVGAGMLRHGRQPISDVTRPLSHVSIDFGIGLDTKRDRRVGFRGQLLAHSVIPNAAIADITVNRAGQGLVSLVTAQTQTFEWSLQLGARVRIRGDGR
ncbi:MAG: hypothetical protein K2X99_05015 [Gemmatimonadaceae bacterium]|nr:hypothetical protein [Gemmatimonadaceae bacterium]